MSAARERRKPSRRRRILGGALLAVAFLLLAAGLFGGWLVTTPAGARWGFERLGAYLPGRLETGRVEGPLRGPLVVRDLRYTSERIHLSADRVALRWNLSALLRQRLDIHALEADSVRLAIVATRTPPAPRDTLAPELPDVDLPLDVLLGRAHVRGLFITPAGSDSAIQVDELTIARAAFRDTLRIGSLDVRAPGGSLHLEGGARTLGRYGVHLQTRWTLRPGDQILHGAGRLVGTLDTLHVVQEVVRPFRASLDVRVFTPMKRLGFAGAVRVSDLDPRALGRDLPGAPVSARVEARGEFDAFQASGTIAGRVPEVGPVRTTFQITRRDSLVVVERLVARAAGDPARVHAHGRVLLGARGTRGDLRGTWTALRWPLHADSGLSSPRGTFHVTGAPERYRLSASGIARHPAVRDVPWSLRGTGTPRGLRLDAVEARPLGGRVDGSAEVAWTGAPRWNARLVARGLDPATAYRGWNGHLGFALDASGSARGEERARFDLSGIEGAVRGAPVTGRVQARLLAGGWAIPGAELSWGGNRFAASGAVGEQWGFDWKLDAPDLTRVEPRWSGRLSGTGEVRGPRRQPVATARLQADSLRSGDVAVRTATLEGEVHPAGEASSHVSLTLAEARTPARVLERAALTIRGTIEEHAIQLTTATARESLRAEAAGSWRRRAWSGRLRTLDLRSEDFGSWALEREALLRAAPPHLRLEGFCWGSEGALWCADAALGPNRAWTLDTRLDNLPLERLAALLPPGVALAGPLDAAADLEGVGARWTGTASVMAGPGTITHGLAGGQPRRTPLDSAAIRVHAGAQGLDGIMAVALGDAGNLAGSLRAPAPQPSGAPGPGPLDGELRIRLHDLGVLEGMLPDFTSTRGTLIGDLRLAGDTRQPRWSGEARLTGQADVPRLGIELRDVTIVAEADPEGRLRLNGGLRSGPGRLAVEGTARMDPAGRPEVRASLQGERFQAMNTRDAAVVVSPRIQLHLRADSLGLTGEVEVPRAKLGEPEERPSAVAVSEDVVFVNADTSDTPGPRAPIRVYAEVRLVLGDDVVVEAYGLEARVSGSVLAIEHPAAPTAGSGELRLVNGTYRAYGQRLEIERGRLVFAGGPIANPGLDVRAVRHARGDVVAGFEVQGTLEQPRFRVISDPPMPEREALAYIMFGKRLDRGSANQQDIVTDAANALGVGGGNLIAGTLARQFGIEDASIESEGGTFEEAALMLGTYLSPRLYVNYGIGLLDPVSTLRIQYFLNDRWTLQAETGEENRAQILYTVER